MTSLRSSPLRGSVCIDYETLSKNLIREDDVGLLQSTSDLIPILARTPLGQAEESQHALPSAKSSPQYVGRRRQMATHSAQVSASDVRALLHSHVSLSSDSTASGPHLPHNAAANSATAQPGSLPGNLEQLSKATQLIDSLQKQLQQAQATIAQQQTQREGEQQALEVLRKELAAKDADIRTLQGTEVQAAERLRLLNDEMESAIQRNKDLQTELSQHKKKMHGAEAAAMEGIQHAQSQQLLAMHEVSVLREKILQQEGSVQALENEVKAAQLEAKYTESLASELRQELALRDKEVGFIRERLAASTQERQQLKEDLLSTRANFTVLKERARSLERMLTASGAGNLPSTFPGGANSQIEDNLPGRALFDTSNISHLNLQGPPSGPKSMSAAPRAWQENSNDRVYSAPRSAALADQAKTGPRLAPLQAECKAPPAGRTREEQDGIASRRRRSSVSGNSSPSARPYGTEISVQDLISKTKRLEDRLMVVSREKELLEAEQARLPATSGRTLAERHRRATMEERLESLTKEAGTLRMSLKQLGVLKK